MRNLTIDAEDLIMALQNDESESEYFLDLQTGEVLFRVDEGISQPDEEFESLLEEYPERFLYISPFPSSDGWRLMAEFIEQQCDGSTRERLTGAINRSLPFRRFKETLAHYPDLRELWFAFERGAMLDIARKWIEAQGIEAELRIKDL
ncbi:MAG: UPF0158 family protein [Pyrinomonadaceae bacterium]